MKLYRVSRNVWPVILNLGLRRRCVVFVPPEQLCSLYTFTRRLGGFTTGMEFWRREKTLEPTGFEPRIIETIAYPVYLTLYPGCP
jgi:hypothetical protein